MAKAAVSPKAVVVVVVDLLFIVAPIVRGGICVWSLFCYSVLCVILVLQLS